MDSLETPISREYTSNADQPCFKQVTTPRIVSMIILMYLAFFIVCILLSNNFSSFAVSNPSEDMKDLEFTLFTFGLGGVVWSAFILMISLMGPGAKMRFLLAKRDLETATNIFNPLYQKYIDLRPDQAQMIKRIINKSRRWGFSSLLDFGIGGLLLLILDTNEVPADISFYLGTVVVILGFVFILLWAFSDTSKNHRVGFLLANRDSFYENLKKQGFKFSIKPGSPMLPGEGAVITKIPDNSQNPDAAAMPSFFAAARDMGYYYQNYKSEINYFLLLLVMTSIAAISWAGTGTGIISFIVWCSITIVFGVLLVRFGLRLVQHGLIVVKVKLSLKIALRIDPALIPIPGDFIEQKEK